MKKTGYAAAKVTPSLEEEKKHDYEKAEDSELPEFSKEVPVSSTKEEEPDGIQIEYEWKESDSQSIKVRRIKFRKNEDLEGLHRIAATDGVDSISFKHNNRTYILRRTMGEVSHALFNVYGKISGIVEDVVGYLRTVLGNEYVITRVSSECWAFDKRIAKGNIRYTDIDSLDQKSKCKLVEMIAEKITELHSRSLIIGRFTLNNVLFCKSDMKLSDLRGLRMSRKKAYLIEEFKSILQYLFTLNVATREDVYAAIAYYTAKNEGAAIEWYGEKTGEKTNDPFDAAEKIEEEIYA